VLQPLFVVYAYRCGNPISSYKLSYPRRRACLSGYRLQGIYEKKFRFQNLQAKKVSGLTTPLFAIKVAQILFGTSTEGLAVLSDLLDAVVSRVWNGMDAQKSEAREEEGG
jgi:hypothetical protein